MNCSKIFLISIITITTIFCTETPIILLKTDAEIERQVDIWLQQYFSANFYHNVGYTPELFNQIKKYLLENNYIQYSFLVLYHLHDKIHLLRFHQDHRFFEKLKD